MPTAEGVVEGEVRAHPVSRPRPLNRPRGPVRLLVSDVLADYSERSLTSALLPIGDAESVVRDVLDRVAGFGPLQRYLDDPEIEEIWVNEPGRLFIVRRGRSELTTTIFGPGGAGRARRADGAPLGWTDRHVDPVSRRDHARRFAPARGHPRVYVGSSHVRSSPVRQHPATPALTVWTTGHLAGRATGYCEDAAPSRCRGGRGAGWSSGIGKSALCQRPVMDLACHWRVRRLGSQILTHKLMQSSS